jgi:hypothetical protein
LNTAKAIGLGFHAMKSFITTCWRFFPLFMSRDALVFPKLGRITTRGSLSIYGFDPIHFAVELQAGRKLGKKGVYD